MYAKVSCSPEPEYFIFELKFYMTNRCCWICCDVCVSEEGVVMVRRVRVKSLQTLG